MLPILLVISFVAPQAWSTPTTGPATAAPVAIAAAPAVATTTVPEVVPAEQARPSTAAREAEWEKAALRAEQAKVRETRERERAEVIRQIVREAERANGEREAVMAAEVRRLLEANKEIQEPAQEVARRRIERAREQNELAMLESKLRQADASMARQRELVEKGLASRQSLIIAEEELNQLRLQLELAKVQKATTAGHELELETRRHQMQELVERGLVAHRNLPALEATATLQPEDRLTITIEGEPDLPKTFTVRADGSIRFPLLGSIRVQGSTTSQVQTAIQKLISDKGLGRNPAVTVSAWRTR